MVRAVCFDLWNTLIFEGPGGLVEPRLREWREALRRVGHEVTHAALALAHDEMFAAFQAAWAANVQFVSADAARAVCERLGLASDPDAVAAVEARFDPAGRSSEIAAVAGAVNCLGRLRAKGVATAVICDVGLVPSTALRWHLARLGIAELIDHFEFSDDAGIYKPDPRTFEAALHALGDPPPSEAVHVGDRVRTDICGALGAGLRAVRFSGVFDDPDAVRGPSHEVVAHLDELPPLLGL